MRFLSDERLYRETDHCLAWLRTLPDAAPGRLREDCHMYWRGALGAKQLFSIKSFLATQDLDGVRLTLWLDAEDDSEPAAPAILQPYLRHVCVRRFDAVEQSRGTPLQGHLDLYRAPGATTASNFARLAILHNHGGLYMDVDTLFLRDLRLLSHVARDADEFCSQWSNHIRAGNSAALRLNAGSHVASTLMERAVEAGTCRSRAILAFDGGEAIDLLVLPSAVFDPLWAHHDGTDRSAHAPFDRFSGFFEEPRRLRRRRVRTIRDFFPGAFTYHWHNCWDAEERRESLFGRFDRELDAVVAT